METTPHPHLHLSLSPDDGSGSGSVEAEKQQPERILLRRRPALSCVECRRRKVKCDRGRPGCGPCVRTGLGVCVYRGDRGATAKGSGAGVGDGDGDGRRGGGCTESVGSGSGSGSGAGSMSMSLEGDGREGLVMVRGFRGFDGDVRQGLEVGDSISQSDSDSFQRLVRRVRELEGRLSMLDDRGGGGGTHGRGGLPLSSVNAKSSVPTGQFMKEKFFGESHWVNCIEPYEALGSKFTTTNPDTSRTEVNTTTDLYLLLLECKALARVIKHARLSSLAVSSPLRGTIYAELQASMPSKDICDDLVSSYLRTFEGPFRVLHIPTFHAEYQRYWADRSDPATQTKPSTLLKILLVLSIGTIFTPDVTSHPKYPSLRTSCTLWIQAAEHWLSAPHEKSRQNLTGLQIHILLLLARQVCGVDGDLMWIPAGAMLRSAMHLGLHREPSHFPKISVFHAEMRRRLWTTVLEITVQTSLDMGMVPMVSLDDYDTLPPSNINDEDIGEEMGGMGFTPRPDGEYTHASMQIALHRTLPIRLEATRGINSLRSPLSYEKTVDLSATLTQTCRSTLQAMRTFATHIPPRPSHHPSPTSFKIKLLDTLNRRFILALHRPFFALASKNPIYHFARKQCLDASLAILAPTSHICPPSPPTQKFQNSRSKNHENKEEQEEEEKDDWTLYLHHSVGFLKWFFLYSTTTVYLELVLQIREHNLSNPYYYHRHHHHPQLGTASIPPPPPPPPQFSTLRTTLALALKTAQDRLKAGETNAKGTVFLACALARVDALIAAASDVDEEEEDDEDSAIVTNAARCAIAEAVVLMREAARRVWGVDVDVELGSKVDLGSFAGVGKEHCHTDEESGVGVQEGLGVGGMGAVPLSESSSLGGVDMGIDTMDWETLMRDEDIDFGFGFESTTTTTSPESWFLAGLEGGW